MHSAGVFLLLAIVAVFYSQCEGKTNPSYWRSFDGTIPQDAVRGGHVPPKKSYIGMSLHQGRLIPSSIDSDGKARFIFGNSVEAVTGNTWILCAPLDKQPIWLPVEIDSIPTTFDPIQGGFENDMVLMIGRVADDAGGLFVGKVFPKTISYKGLEIHTPQRTTTMKKGIHEFELLGYKSKATSGIV